jgi:hypothetical protein
MKISLCLLTFNELVGCQNDVPAILKIKDQFDELYAVDAGSHDGTIEFLKKNNIPVYIQPKKGLNAAYEHAFEKCATEAVVFFHPKGSIPAEDTLQFRKYFEDGYGLVIGSRIAKRAKNEEDEKLFKPRKWFVEGLALFTALLFWKEGKLIWDVLHGFRGITVEAFQKMKIADPGKVTIDLETVARAYKKRIKRTEFPTSESPRLAGETHFKAWPTGVNLLKYLWREMRRKN